MIWRSASSNAVFHRSRGPVVWASLSLCSLLEGRGTLSVLGDIVSSRVRVLRPQLNALLVFTGGASGLRGHGLMGSIQRVWPLSLQCRFKCNMYRSVTPAVSLVDVHHSSKLSWFGTFRLSWGSGLDLGVFFAGFCLSSRGKDALLLLIKLEMYP